MRVSSSNNDKTQQQERKCRIAMKSFATNNNPTNLTESTATSGGGVRINLRKRDDSSSSSASSSKRARGPMSTYNSAFLSGLFADIANANKLQDDDEDNMDTDTTATCATTHDPRLDDTSSNKRSRVSMTKSISRCHKSFGNLSAALSTPSTTTTDVFPIRPTCVSPGAPAVQAMQPHDSLSEQLFCVAGGQADQDTDLSYATSSLATNVGKIAFPHLPATVSDVSCTTLARKNSSTRSLSYYETDDYYNEKESYGWFVQMDHESMYDDDETTVSPTNMSDSRSSSCSELAFSGANTKKKTQQDAVVEWAQAADTVDDVLGDFF